MKREAVVNLFKKVARILEDDKQYEWLADEVKDYLNEIYVNEEAELEQPEQEPLSEDKLDVLAEANITDEGIAGYYLGFRDAEKHHGIGGGE